ncbi:MAG: hypothetical protein DHS80DRAFT_21925 [Piptocephalis tieghemiana]|nr:MAG: hypothetical protein DHS80DRAFT_21925 [Piptocephalis tieghemiana]
MLSSTDHPAKAMTTSKGKSPAPTAVLTVEGGAQEEEYEARTKMTTKAKEEKKGEEEEEDQEALDKGKAFGVSLRPVKRSSTSGSARELGTSSFGVQTFPASSPQYQGSLVSPFLSSSSSSSSPLPSTDQKTFGKSGSISSTLSSSSSKPTPPPVPQRAPTGIKKPKSPPTVASLMTQLPQVNRQRYMGAFRHFHPSYPDTPIPSHVVRQVWEASQLQTATLARIWDFVHQGQPKGSLDKKGWSVGLWLIDEHLAGRPYPIPNVPEA